MTLPKFYKNQFEKEMLIAKLQRSPSLYNIFKKKKDLTKEIDEDIKSRFHQELKGFCAILITGQQGGWKSSLAQEIAIENDETFNEERIYFLYNDFRKALEKAKKGEWYILDENVFISGTGSGAIVESIQTLIEVIRQAQISVILITPTRKYLPEHIFTHHFETIDRSLIGKCDKEKNPHDIRTCQEQKHNNMDVTIRSSIIREGEYVGFYIKKIHWKNKVWQGYQEKKKEFLKKALTEDFQKLSYEDIAKEIISNPKSKEYRTTKQLMLFLEQEHPNLTVGQKMLLIEAIKIQRKFEEEIEREKL
jgi:hypothetical protein